MQRTNSALIFSRLQSSFGVRLAQTLAATLVAAIVVGAYAVGTPAAVAAEEAEPAVPSAAATEAAATGAEEQATLRQLVERLRIENELLKKENQQLRRLLLNRSSPTNAAMAKVAGASAATEGGTGDPEKPFWLSSGGKRHNQTCRYFKKTTGKPCNAQEGTACKICGG